jgi:catechol 2,3-dioxygenase-like lactoylglutathione lyase family enzyme
MKGSAMQLQDLYFVVITDKLKECKDFYTNWFGFKVLFEASWFIYLASQGEHSFGLAFMSPEHPSSPPNPGRYNGSGSFITLQVENVTTTCQRLRDAGLQIAYELKDEPWGQRRFGLHDPAGMWVDVVQQIEPAPGFWDKYI